MSMGGWIERYVVPYRRVAIVAVLAALGLAAVVAGVWYWQAAEERRATATYASALARLASAGGRELAPEARAAAARDLEAALQAYPSASMAAQAAFELAGLRFADRQYAQARSAYEVALARAVSRTLRTLARLGIATTWEAERNFAKAVEAYQAALADLGPNDFQYEDTLLSLARSQELGGRRDDAVQTYRRVLKDVPKTSRTDEVRARLASLGATP